MVSGERQGQPVFPKMYFGAAEMMVSEAVAKTLKALDVKRIFLIPGGASMHLNDFLSRSDVVTHSLCGDEIGAAFQAQAYAAVASRETGYPLVGVCEVTSGPGVAKGLVGLMNATADSQPLMVISGNVATDAPPDAFQGLSVVPLAEAGNFVKGAVYLDDPSKAQEAVFKLFQAALEGRPGGVLLDIPKNIQPRTTKYRTLEQVVSGNSIPFHNGQSRLDRKVVREIARALRTAESPLVIAGQGACGAAQELAQLVEQEDLYVISTLLGLPASCNINPQKNLGLGGMYGEFYANLAHAKGRFRLYLGSSLDDRLMLGSHDGSGYEGITIVQVDKSAGQIGKILAPTYGVVADVKQFLTALLQELKSIGGKIDHSNWNSLIEHWREKLPKPDYSNVPYLLSEHVIDEVGRRFGKNARLVADVGAHQMRVAQRLGRLDYTSGRFGCMGFALAAAVGVVTAMNDYGLEQKPVVAFAGDGCSIMSLHEWYDVARTIAEFGVEKSPLKVVAFIDGTLGMVGGWQTGLFGGRTATSDLTYGGRIRFNFLAAPRIFEVDMPDGSTYTVPGKIVGTREELPAAVDEMYNTPGPYLLQVQVPPRQVTPAIYPGGNTMMAIQHDPLNGDRTLQELIKERNIRLK